MQDRERRWRVGGDRRELSLALLEGRRAGLVSERQLRLAAGLGCPMPDELGLEPGACIAPFRAGEAEAGLDGKVFVSLEGDLWRASPPFHWRFDQHPEGGVWRAEPYDRAVRDWLCGSGVSDRLFWACFARGCAGLVDDVWRRAAADPRSVGEPLEDPPASPYPELIDEEWEYENLDPEDLDGFNMVPDDCGCCRPYAEDPTDPAEVLRDLIDRAPRSSILAAVDAWLAGEEGTDCLNEAMTVTFDEPLGLNTEGPCPWFWSYQAARAAAACCLEDDAAARRRIASFAALCALRALEAKSLEEAESFLEDSLRPALMTRVFVGLAGSEV